MSITNLPPKMFASNFQSVQSATMVWVPSGARQACNFFRFAPVTGNEAGSAALSHLHAQGGERPRWFATCNAARPRRCSERIAHPRSHHPPAAAR